MASVENKVHGALLAVLVDGVRVHAPALLGDAEAVSEAAELVALLARVADDDGEEAVIRVGEAGIAHGGHPLQFFLHNSGTVAELVHKVQTHQRAMHAVHRMHLHLAGPRRLDIEHLRVDGEPAPRLASLFATGCSVAALRIVGCCDVTLRLPLMGDHELIGSAVSAPPAGPGAHRWRVEWSEERPRRPVPGLDEWLLQSLPSEPMDHTIVAAVAAVFDGDPACTWRVERVGELLAMSPRSLQRQLAQHGTSFSELLWARRLRSAARTLASTDLPVAVVAEQCGFSDPSHLIRRFREAFGQNPAAWRLTAPRPADGG
jgi:AraC-like DNA-binding protein